MPSHSPWRFDHTKRVRHARGRSSPGQKHMLQRESPGWLAQHLAQGLAASQPTVGAGVSKPLFAPPRHLPVCAYVYVCMQRIPWPGAFIWEVSLVDLPRLTVCQWLCSSPLTLRICAGGRNVFLMPRSPRERLLFPGPAKYEGRFSWRQAGEQVADPGCHIVCAVTQSKPRSPAAHRQLLHERMCSVWRNTDVSLIFKQCVGVAAMDSKGCPGSFRTRQTQCSQFLAGRVARP